MNELEGIIRKRIKDGGPMNFSRFMATALYEPKLGYYMRDDLEIGVKGDFYTSPHLHPAFGAMIARQAQECWEAMGQPDEFSIVEAGSGRGFLALDLMDYLSGKPLYSRLSYRIIELNPALLKKQRELLRGHKDKVSWHERLEQAAPVRGMIVTNELLDALPVHLFVKLAQSDEPNELSEIYIALRGGVLVEEPGPLSTPRIKEYLNEFGVKYGDSMGDGMRSEVHLAMKDWLKEASSALEEGFLLTIDYGFPSNQYYSQDRPQGTLLCYHNHTANEDFLSRIGEQDITAHVNFSALKHWGEELGLVPLGFTRQGPYLVSLGLDEVVTEMYTDGKGLGRDLPKIQSLIMGGTMGDTHKVMLQCTGKYSGLKPRGFTLKNQLESL